jgi:tetratricopeptide (TPR) repeat protein
MMQEKDKPAVLVTGLGNVNHPVSTKNAQAQKFFNQGLAYIFAFNHDESVKAFKRAAELDPKLAMAYWGIALARGSNYNVSADKAQLKEAWDNLQKANSLASKASAQERAYIHALSKRYSPDEAADQKKLGEAYTAAMKELGQKYPNDLDAATLYAESMMNLRPWQLWSLDGKPAEGTLEIVAMLEKVLKRNPNHIGANHYYIHAVEASPDPDRALPSAMRIAKLAPNAGHLVHMPSHIYIRTGNYNDAAKSNADAIIVDKNYIRQNGAENLYSMMYYNHNIHFLASSSVMLGRYGDAMKAARDLEKNVTPLLKQMPMLQMFVMYPLIVQVRFEKWDEIMKYPAQPKELKVNNAFWYMARGLALAKAGKSGEAEKELAAMRENITMLPPDIPFGNNASPEVIKVGETLLAGEIALSRGDKNRAVELLREAAALEDKVNYNEPPDWDIPTREFLGRALLIKGDYAEAEKVYRDELVKHRHNARALFGLGEALNKQKKFAEAKKVRLEFTKKWAGADTKLTVAGLYNMTASSF